MTPPSAQALECLARFLAAWGRPAALVGGMAMVARVWRRPTVDLDVMVAVPAGTEQALLDLARDHGYTFDPQRTRDFLPGGLVQLFGPEGARVDLLFADDPMSESVLSRATRERLLGVELPVATVEDLLLMKLEANRPSDLDDAIAIKDAFQAELDKQYLRHWAHKLGIADRLQALIGR
ncbi:MAG: hypothetical protein HYZ28_23805 [Myxococcales bacterium]|nr:hypothetical protein [Myxococcales bacterium]